MCSNSPSFYRAGLPDKRGYRSLLRNKAVRPINVDDKSARSFGPSISQLGSLNTPVIFDDRGGVHTFARYPIFRTGTADPCKNDMASVEIRREPIAAKSKVSCPSGGGGMPNSSVPPGLSGARAAGGVDKFASSFIVNDVTTYLNADGKVIVSTAGQVCNKVLLSRDNKIVYYDIEVNDVYAYFLTGFIKKKFDFDTFPTGSPVTTTAGAKTDDITEIKEFAEKHGAKLLDEKALAVELKTAWIEIDNRDKGRFVTTSAAVPIFKRDNATHWRADGWKIVHLGLVGMHIVFSASSNPEMIWATFEHIDNAPNDKYQYCQKSQDDGCKKVATHWRDKSTMDWLFSANNSLSANNQQLAYLYKGDICGYNSSAIGPNNILRKHAWGSMFGSTPAAELNTEIINVNHDVLASVPAGDVRRNYVLIGSMWTRGGVAPGSPVAGPQRLVNMTMETFFQDSNCFGCHRGITQTVEMSHIFDRLRPLLLRQGKKE